MSTMTRHPEQIAEMTILASEELRRFRLTPKVALVSHSSFGSSNGLRQSRCVKRWPSSSNAPPISK